MDTTKSTAEFWALVELFGHTKLAGFLSEQTIGGQSFVRVDVPDTSKQKGFTRLLGNGAIYAINPVAEDIARGLAESLQVKPVSPWDLPEDYRDAISNHQKMLTAKRIGDQPEEPDFGSDGDDDDDVPM